MNRILKRKSVFLIILAVMLIFCLSLVCLAVSSKPASADSFVKYDTAGDISVGHITDTHYYPFRLIYTGDPNVGTKENADYCYNWIMEKSTKLWLESATAFDASLMRLGGVTMDPSKIPDYLVLSGDCGQDGELLAHIDVANKFRLLQNYIRKNYKPGFQIFVVMGNHDLYNPETYRFDNANGLRTAFLYTSRMEAVKIYAGLGYPNMTDEEAAVFYAGLANDTETTKYNGANNLYDYSGFASDLHGSDLPYYVRSNLSEDFTYAWQFVKEDSETQVFDPATYGADNLTMAKFLAKEEGENVGIVKTINNRNASDGTKFYSMQRLNDTTDLAMGDMSGIASRKDGQFSVAMLDVILSNADDGHVLGGRLQPETMDFMNAHKAMVRPNDNTLAIATAHHSVNPHWDMEEEITTGFILYNPIEASDFLADSGIRYVYTGHQHANDSTARVSTNGNIIYDMESAANVSAGSQIKITRISRGTVNGVYAEKANLEEWENNELSTDRSMVPTSYKLYDNVFKGDPYGYVKKNDIGEFVDKNDGHILNYSRLTQRRVYDNALLNVIDNFFQKDITQKLGTMVAGIEIAGFISFKAYADDIVIVADNLISEVNNKVLADYTYSGKTERFRANDMKIFGYLEELINRVAYYCLVPGDENANVFTVVMECYMRHNLGENWETTEQMPENYRKVLERVRSGEFVRILVDELLSYDTGLMKVIKGLAETDLDLSKDTSNAFRKAINGLLQGYAPGVTLANFNLGKLLSSAKIADLINGLLTSNFGLSIDLVNNSVTDVFDDLVDKYITDNFLVSLGEYAYNIGVAFGVNNNVNRLDVQGNGTQYLLTVKERSSDYSYLAKKYDEEISVENGKLPSMITTNFGSDPETTENFTYFTDRRITDGAIEYTTDLTAAHANAKRVNAKTEIYATTKGLIDLGIWCQAGYLELARHTVSLTGLQPGTTYAYRLGSPSNSKYWSEWFEFTTADSDGFAVLISSDLQSSTETSYQRINTIYNNVIEQQFADGVDFLLNPGDFVDNGRNLTQFRWSINSARNIYASIPMVITAGNHDEKYFDIDKAKNSKEYTMSKNVVKGQYNYLWSHFNYVLSDEQNQSSGFYYSFDYSDVHFVVLNTNDITTVGSAKQLGAEQFDWLEKDLKASKKTYKVVLMHKSLYSEGSHSYDPDVMGMRAQLTPLFAENGVNLVIAGHDHVYNETFYLDKDGNKVNTDANSKNEIATDKGTLYVTMGTMGEKFYNFVDNPDVPTNVGEKLHKEGRLTDPTFGKLELKDGVLSYTGYQYKRELSEDKKEVLGGTIEEIKKGGDMITTIVGIAITGAMVLAVLIAVIVSIVVAAKRKKA